MIRKVFLERHKNKEILKLDNKNYNNDELIIINIWRLILEM